MLHVHVKCTAATTNSLARSGELHRGALNDGHRLDDLLLVKLGPELVNDAHDVRHAGLVAHKGSQVALVLGVVVRELPDAATDALAPLAREKAEGAVARAFELTVRHDGSVEGIGLGLVSDDDLKRVFLH